MYWGSVHSRLIVANCWTFCFDDDNVAKNACEKKLTTSWLQRIAVDK